VLACELGPHGIRAVTLESGGVLNAVPEDSEGRDTIIERIVAATMLGAGGDVRRRRQRGRLRRLGSGPHDHRLDDQHRLRHDRGLQRTAEPAPSPSACSRASAAHANAPALDDEQVAHANAKHWSLSFLALKRLASERRGGHRTLRR
jgi:hypothetical protein